SYHLFFFFFQAEDGIRDFHVTGVQTCALPILRDQYRQLGEKAVHTLARLVLRPPRSDRLFARRRDHLAERKGDERELRLGNVARSEERRVGKEGRWRGSTYREKRKGKGHGRE